MSPINNKISVITSAKSSARKSVEVDSKIKIQSTTKFKADKPAKLTGMKLNRTPLNIPADYLKKEAASTRKRITFNSTSSDKLDASRDPPSSVDTKSANSTLDNVTPVVPNKSTIRPISTLAANKPVSLRDPPAAATAAKSTADNKFINTAGVNFKPAVMKLETNQRILPTAANKPGSSQDPPAARKSVTYNKSINIAKVNIKPAVMKSEISADRKMAAATNNKPLNSRDKPSASSLIKPANFKSVTSRQSVDPPADVRKYDNMAMNMIGSVVIKEEKIAAADNNKSDNSRDPPVTMPRSKMSHSLKIDEIQFSSIKTKNLNKNAKNAKVNGIKIEETKSKRLPSSGQSKRKSVCTDEEIKIKRDEAMKRKAARQSITENIENVTHKNSENTTQQAENMLEKAKNPEDIAKNQSEIREMNMRNAKVYESLMENEIKNELKEIEELLAKDDEKEKAEEAREMALAAAREIAKKETIALNEIFKANQLNKKMQDMSLSSIESTSCSSCPYEFDRESFDFDDSVFEDSFDKIEPEKVKTPKPQLVNMFRKLSTNNTGEQKVIIFEDQNMTSPSENVLPPPTTSEIKMDPPSDDLTSPLPSASEIKLDLPSDDSTSPLPPIDTSLDDLYGRDLAQVRENGNNISQMAVPMNIKIMAENKDKQSSSTPQRKTMKARKPSSNKSTPAGSSSKSSSKLRSSSVTTSIKRFFSARDRNDSDSTQHSNDRSAKKIRSLDFTEDRA